MDETFAEIVALATKGRTAYQIQLGHAYLTGTPLGGHPVAQDFSEARMWLQRAHDRGAFTATHMLGSLFEEGRGVAVDLAKAIELYEQAAERGSYLSCVRLARIYAKETHMPQALQLATSWYEKVLSFEGTVDDQGEMAEARAYLGQ